MAKKQVMIYMDEDLLAKADKKRGLVPRSAYVCELIRRDTEDSQDVSQ